MDANERSLRQLLHGTSYRVPPFQRRYSWKAREFERLWEDIEALLTKDSKRHFMGAVVLEPTPTYKLFDVIDGQQRIATFTIALMALRQLAAEFAPLRRRPIHTLLFADGRPRFKPSLHDSDAFSHLLENPELLRKVAHKSVWTGYQFFREQFSNYITSEKGQRPTHLLNIERALLDSMIFVEILLSTDDDAQGVFETINYVGVPLTAADLARNFVLSRVKRGDEQKRINHNYWQQIERALEDSISTDNSKRKKKQLQKVLPEFLRAMLTVERGRYISYSDLYRELRLFFGKGNLEEKLELTLKYAKTFSHFLNPDIEGKVLLKAPLSRFNELRMSTHYPILLVLYAALAEGRLTVRQTVVAMRSIESFVVRRAFNSKVSRDLNLVFANIAVALKKVERSTKLDAILSQMLAQQKWPSDAEFRSNFASSPIYSNARQIARFALASIERDFPAHKERALEDAQIEHIFPQQPAAGWQEQDLTDLKRCLHVIGNLTLTQYNASYSNSTFQEKLKGKDGYRRSPYLLTKMISSDKEWTAASVQRRGRRLLRIAMKIWPGP